LGRVLYLFQFVPTFSHGPQPRFQNGLIDGDGADGLDTFVISGGYDSRTMECFWQKIYPTRSPVAYEGYREGKGIWGRWKLTNARGGFHIWPLTEGGPPDLKRMEEEESLESVIEEPLVSVPVTLDYKHGMPRRS
jgi:hypothetical protein